MILESPEEFLNNRIEIYVSGGGKIYIHDAIQLLSDYRDHLQSLPFKIESEDGNRAVSFCKKCNALTHHKKKYSSKGKYKGNNCCVCSMKSLRNWTVANPDLAVDAVVDQQTKYIRSNRKTLQERIDDLKTIKI